MNLIYIHIFQHENNISKRYIYQMLIILVHTFNKIDKLLVIKKILMHENEKLLETLLKIEVYWNVKNFAYTYCRYLVHYNYIYYFFNTFGQLSCKVLSNIIFNHETSLLMELFFFKLVYFGIYHILIFT